ncbi:MAG: leucine-rich repeat domain-containing protein, partial [Eubacterium sp.]|nr:leucine-rich repeat domain-containing protein [Eubacterium sp.]
MNNYIRITTICFILIVSAALFGVAETVQAETYSGKCGEDVYWNYDSEEEVFRVSGNGAMTSAPWMHGSEDYDAQYGNITFYDTKVVIEKGVTAVVDDAFYFRGIKEVVFGPDVVEIGERAFSTTNLSNISFSDSIRKVGKCAFDVTRIRSIDLKNVEEVGERAFEGCGNLEKVVFGENLKTISKGAFADCLNLKEIEFRGGTPKIAKSAFKDDRFLKKIINHSNVSIPIQNLDKDLFWYQDGKKVTSVSPGKTAKSKGRLFRVKYKDLQGKIQGKLPKSYR